MKYKWIILFVIGFLAGCANGKYYEAQSKYKARNYAIAIELYDEYIQTAKNGAIATNAEMERSKCYFELGKRAMEKENWVLALRMFFLSNSNQSDSLADNCYYEMAQLAIQKKDYEKAILYLDFIEDYFLQSELYCSVLLIQIKIYYLQFNQKDVAFKHYRVLYEKYPECTEIEAAQLLIDEFFEQYIEEALAYRQNINIDAAIQQLELLHSLPSKYNQHVAELIADQYMDLAAFSIAQEDYLEADEYFKKAIEFDYTRKKIAEDRLIALCQKFVDKGNKLIAQRNIKAAQRHFTKAFEIIPNYQPAMQALAKATTFETKIQEADAFFQSGLILEKKRQYKEAKKKYQKAYNVDALPKYEEKVQRMQNMLEIEKDPVVFARKIIRNYKKGSLITKLNELDNALIKQYGIEEVKTSDWRVLLSTGQDKYEVRYDISTPDKNYYFIWQVSLRTRKVIPLNNATEEFFGL